MSNIVKEFDQYTIYYLGGKELLNGTMYAEIDCFKGNNRVGELLFVKNEILPSNAYYPRVDRINLYYEISRFNDVVTILRYEKPLYLSFDDATKNGYISTAYEPIGEEEG